MQSSCGGKTEKPIFLPVINIGGKIVSIFRYFRCLFSPGLHHHYSMFRYDDYYKTPDEGYPRHISNWRGVPANIDGVITWTDGKIYCFLNF